MDYPGVILRIFLERKIQYHLLQVRRSFFYLNICRIYLGFGGVIQPLLHLTRGLPWLSGQRHLTRNQDLSLWVQYPAMPEIFLTPDWKKINNAPSVRLIVICSDSYNIPLVIHHL